MMEVHWVNSFANYFTNYLLVVYYVTNTHFNLAISNSIILLVSLHIDIEGYFVEQVFQGRLELILD